VLHVTRRAWGDEEPKPDPCLRLGKHSIRNFQSTTSYNSCVLRLSSSTKTANHVLEQALKPGINGIPKKMFEDAIGIVIASSFNFGLIFSGTAGSGIAIKKTDEGWGSPPCAVGMSGIGFGLQIGASVRDIIIFIYDEKTMESIATQHGGQVSANLELTLGPFGRLGKGNINASKGGWGPTVAIAYSKGLFAGYSCEGAKLGAREFVNNRFYSTPTVARDILYTPGSVRVPAHKVTMLNEIYDKLTKLQEGVTAEPDASEEAKKQEAKEVADKESEAVKDHPEAEVVPAESAADEAAKEKS
jgi:lipid-binding SYLF domain-containing protein